MEELEYSDDPDEPPATLRILVRNQVGVANLLEYTCMYAMLAPW